MISILLFYFDWLRKLHHVPPIGATNHFITHLAVPFRSLLVLVLLSYSFPYINSIYFTFKHQIQPFLFYLLILSTIFFKGGEDVMNYVLSLYSSVIYTSANIHTLSLMLFILSSQPFIFCLFSFLFLLLFSFIR